MEFTKEETIDILTYHLAQDDLEDFLQDMYEAWIEIEKDSLFSLPGEALSEKHRQMRLIIHLFKLLYNDQIWKIERVPSNTGDADAHNSESN